MDNNIQEIQANFFDDDWTRNDVAKLFDIDYDYYFDSYSYVSIHEEMLKDKARTIAYSKAIMSNKHMFKNKIVLDIGAGTGILSMFAAKAGAKYVYAVEYSAVATFARKIVEDNGFSGVIEVINKKAEDLDLRAHSIDIIISEWMGYMLLFESMLNSIIICRDKFLKKNGLIFPSKAYINMACIEDGQYKYDKLNYWDSVYGFNYSCIKPAILQEPDINNISEDALISNTICIACFDLYTIKIEDIDFSYKFSFTFMVKEYCHGFVIWFDVWFPGHVQSILSTSPFTKSTHWKQTIIYLSQDLPVNTNDKLEGIIGIRKCSIKPRNINIKVYWKYNDIEDCQYYYLR